MSIRIQLNRHLNMKNALFLSWQKELFLSLPILERAEIHHIFCLLFERFEDTKISSGYLIFNKNLYASYKSTWEFTHVVPSENDIGQKILGLPSLHLMKDYDGNFGDKKQNCIFFLMCFSISLSCIRSFLICTMNWLLEKSIL